MQCDAFRISVCLSSKSRAQLSFVGRTPSSAADPPGRLFDLIKTRRAGRGRCAEAKTARSRGTALLSIRFRSLAGPPASGPATLAGAERSGELPVGAFHALPQEQRAS